MCFSAQASFIAAGGLSIVSLLSIKKAHNTPMLALATSPLFFGIQQACEGLVWITLNASDTTSFLHKFGMYGFLFFAAFWWPIWIPLTVYIPEKIHKRKKLLLTILIMGIATAITMFLSWVPQTSGAEIIHHHLNYPVPHYPFGITNEPLAFLLTWIISLSYCAVTIIPLCISSIPYAWTLGIALGSGLIISYIFYLAAFPSVWCFFAAICSILIYFVVSKSQERMH